MFNPVIVAPPGGDNRTPREHFYSHFLIIFSKIYLIKFYLIWFKK